MDRFNTLLEAGEFASARCMAWEFADSDEKYDIEGLLGIAEVHDEENPADEDSFYVVSLSGAIGICEDGATIDWLFLPLGAVKVDLPTAMQVVTQKNFCAKCGSRVNPGTNFCGQCGGRL